MSSLTIRKLNPAVKERLRARAVRQGHSMETEACLILEQVLLSNPLSGRELYERIRGRFEPIGGVELDIPPRGPGREPPHFE